MRLLDHPNIVRYLGMEMTNSVIFVGFFVYVLQRDVHVAKLLDHLNIVRYLGMEMTNSVIFVGVFGVCIAGRCPCCTAA